MKLRKLPIPLAFFLILAGLLGGIFLVGKIQNWNKSAAGGTSPKQIKITNIDSASFVVSWITNEATTGSLTYGEDNSLGESQKDIRDKNSGNPNKYLTHFLVLENLKPSTKYYFKILSDGKLYDNSGKIFELSTAPASSPNDNDITQGRILKANGQPAQNSIVYLSLANTITQATITDENGHWMVPLSIARNIDLQTYSTYDREAQIEEIFVQGESQTASASLSTKNDNPSPDIVLGQTYNFLEQMAEQQPTPTFIKNQSVDPNNNFQGTTENVELKIISPSENEEVNTLIPEFLGAGPKNQSLEIKVESEQLISDKIIVDKVGGWAWSPKTPLTPGEHTITVSYSDKDGFLQKVSRSFTVLAEGQSNLPAFTATPSGQKSTPTPTIITSPVPTSTILPTITISPSTTVSPTKEPTTTPTTKPRTTVPSTSSGTPTSGAVLPTKLFFGAGIFTLIIGIVLVLL